jgi:outer membrane protein OmpU
MNKLTKIGVTALCGSLAAVASANAGTMTVKGGATATWSSNEMDVTGNPIGMNSGLTFTGSGELDNGTTFTLTLTNADQSAYSAGQIALTLPTLGTLTIDQSGGGLDRIDDMMPTAWEETTGTSLGTGIVNVVGVSGSASLDLGVSADMLPEGIALNLAWTPRATASGNKNDKAVGGAGNAVGGTGWDIVLQHSGLMDGLNVFGGMSTIEQAALFGGDKNEKTLGATYATGGFTLGYQYSMSDTHQKLSTATATYENTLYGVSFAVNDDLSISYGKQTSDRKKVNGTNVEAEVDSIQLAYSMGGASIKIAETDASNINYGTADKGATTLALTLAF